MARQHDDNMRGENYWQNGELLRELGMGKSLVSNTARSGV
jgi:hypothetical protein